MKQTFPKRHNLKKIPLLKWVVIFFRSLKRKNGIGRTVKKFFEYRLDFKRYRKLNINSVFSINTSDLFPRIFDKTQTTDIDPVYYLQGTWCAKKIFNNKPEKHYDIGSQIIMVGIISQFTPTVMIDIRPLSVSLPELSFIKGDITKLPFKDTEISSLSSICVIEHIGLGRYGDPLDQFGTEKAAKELSRVLSRNGHLYISVPVDIENRTYFNAHRAFTRDYILELFKGLELLEEKYIYGNKIYSNYDRSKEFGTGLFEFRKI